jgi:Peptidase M50B-like
MLPNATLVETCVHEAGHSVAMILLGSTITELVVNDNGGGHCHGEPVRGLRMPKPWEPRAVGHCASDFIGCIAAGRAFSYSIVSDEDFRKHGGRLDVDNFYRRADLLGCDPNQTAALHHLAIEAAHRIIDEFAPAIDALADHLYVYRRLGHDEAIRVIRGTPCADRLLAAQMPTRAHRVSPLRSTRLWDCELHDCGGGSVVLVRDGRREVYDSVTAAAHAAARL